MGVMSMCFSKQGEAGYIKTTRNVLAGADFLHHGNSTTYTSYIILEQKLLTLAEKQWTDSVCELANREAGEEEATLLVWIHDVFGY
jgi:hypothetical protein